MWERTDSGKTADSNREIVTDGGQNTGVEMGAVVIGILSILYFLLNLLGTLAYLGLSGASSSVGATGGTIFFTVATIVSLVLTIGFLAAPIGVFTGSSWGWMATAGVWALNLVWGLATLVINGFNIDVLNIVFLVINLVILGYIYSEKMHLVTGDGSAASAV